MKEIKERTNQYGKFKVWDIERLLELQRMLDDGKTFKEIGDHFGVSGTRIKQIARIRLGYVSR